MSRTWYIYDCKQKCITMCVLDYIKLVKDKLCIEKTICEISNEDSFEKKWKQFYELF